MTATIEPIQLRMRRRRHLGSHAARLVMSGLFAAIIPWGAAMATEPMLQLISPPTAADTDPSSPFPFDIAFGIAGTTDYVSRGITNSANKPAIQGYIEPSFGLFYANIWSSNVDFGAGYSGAEIDTALGVRPEFGPLQLDLGYVHYFYAPESVSPDYGELYAKADYDVSGLFTLAARLYFAPDYNQSGNTATFVAGGVEIPLPHDFTIYGGIGYQFFEDPSAYEQLAWTAGISHTWKSLTFDLRYWDTDLSDEACIVRSGLADGCDARVVFTLSFDTTLSELKKQRR